MSATYEDTCPTGCSSGWPRASWTRRPPPPCGPAGGRGALARRASRRWSRRRTARSWHSFRRRRPRRRSVSAPSAAAAASAQRRGARSSWGAAAGAGRRAVGAAPDGRGQPPADGVGEYRRSRDHDERAADGGARLYVYRHGARRRRAAGRRSAGSARRSRAARLRRPRRGYGVLLSIDGARKVTLHWPEAGQRRRRPLQASGEMRLPSAYELDDAPAFERFFLVRADEPFSVATAWRRPARSLLSRRRATSRWRCRPVSNRFPSRWRRRTPQEGASMTTRNPLPALAAALFLLFLVGVC